jgi:hypothetical protein
MIVTITLTVAGSETGPFNLYSDTDGYTAAFETGVAKASLLAGYTSNLVPNGTTIIRVMSDNPPLCTNYIDIPVVPCTTTTTTTTAAPCVCYFILNETGGSLDYTYTPCGGEPVTNSLGAGQNVQVCSASSPTGFSLTIAPCSSTTSCTSDGECEGCT